jgi:hypothetical protein
MRVVIVKIWVKTHPWACMMMSSLCLNFYLVECFLLLHLPCNQRLHQVCVELFTIFFIRSCWYNWIRVSFPCVDLTFRKRWIRELSGRLRSDFICINSLLSVSIFQDGHRGCRLAIVLYLVAMCWDWEPFRCRFIWCRWYFELLSVNPGRRLWLVEHSLLFLLVGKVAFD